VINLSGIEKTYRSKDVSCHALQGIDLEIEKGEFVAITGRSGCGKTTLMNIIGFMDKHDSGLYLFDGDDVSQYKHSQTSSFRNRSIGFVFQSFNLVNDFTVAENVEMPMGYAGIPAKERRARAMAALESVGLADKQKNRPMQLSGGQQQRVAIARALVNEPQLILADEPTGNLDSQSGNDIMELLCKLHSNGKTVVMVTHDESIAAFAKRRVVMSDGRVVSQSP